MNGMPYINLDKGYKIHYLDEGEGVFYKIRIKFQITNNVK
ncbi:MAG: hypothetical protein BAJALOKI3v1_150001 [Promethearchaeota archaeon]|nr:MAG: hypothetical protein BAJALOKI3v1_150001 [Candidatus Lokiarchaeota archaeon]